MTVGAVTVAGIAAHAVATNIRKRSVIAQGKTESDKVPEKG